LRAGPPAELIAMPSDRWIRLQSLFEAAVRLPPAERRAYLDEACPDDPELRQRVLDLLEHTGSSEQSDFLVSPIAASVRDLAGTAAGSRLGERVGPYRLTAELGHGGMGTVYLAERADAEYEARVAIKFVRGAFAAPELVRRLRTERQVLAGLQHPGIARLLDGGTAADGTPYLVMEHVEGEPIDAWCEARQVDLPGRIDLFLKVCTAVQYAHQALVVHRDLKPSNILVQADGTPKLVDFGIAKLLDPTEGDGGEVTATIGMMTPSYASPEQVLGKPVTMATDVYSLAVVLYRLLTGRPPFDLGDATPAEILRRVTADEPRRPSQATTDRHVARALAGDLDTIILKALRKEPERRYGTVAELVDDIRRHLNGRPVLARRETFGYVAGKFVRRHRAALAGLTGVVLLVGGLTVFYTRRLSEERDQARAAAARAARIVAFLKGVFLEASPDVQQGQVLTAPQLLARGVSQIDSGLAAEPATQADLKNVVGDVYRGLGMYDEARKQLEGALRIWQRSHLPEDTVLADIYSNLSTVTRVAGDYVAADSFAQKGTDLMRRLVGTENVAYAGVLNNLAEAKRVRGDYAAAETLYRQDLAIRRRILPPVHPDIEESLNNLALLLLAEGKYAQADSMQREALSMVEALGTPYRFEVSNVQQNLAIILTLEGLYAPAESLYVEALAARRETFGPDKPRTLNTEQNYGWLLYAEGRYGEAKAMLEDQLARAHRSLPPDHPYVAYAEKWLALTLSALGMRDSARATATRSVDAFLKRVGPNHIATLQATRALGLVNEAAGDRAAAESLLVDVYNRQRTHLGVHHPDTRETARDLVKLYDAWGKPEKAAQYEAAGK
jgi:tetratricopeptide (TPR) repeat protein